MFFFLPVIVLGILLLLALATAVISLAGALASVSLVALTAQISNILTQCLVGLGALIVCAIVLLRQRIIIALLAKRFGLKMDDVGATPLGQTSKISAQTQLPIIDHQLPASAPTQSIASSASQPAIDSSTLKEWGF